MNANPNLTIQICHGPVCSSNFSDAVAKKAREVVAKNNLADVKIEASGCLGLCACGPNIRILNNQTGKIEEKNDVTPKEIEKIINELQ